jgi:hypothetical protein
VEKSTPFKAEYATKARWPCAGDIFAGPAPKVYDEAELADHQPEESIGLRANP